MMADEAVADRVRATVAEAAETAISAHRATVDVRRLSDIYDDAEYDCPVVVLTPATAEAAAVRVEVQDHELWWLSVGDGPGTELYAGIEKQHGDRYALLARLVRTVVDGRYYHGPARGPSRRSWRSRITPTGWRETYETDEGPFASTHYGRDLPRDVRRFAPYV